MAELSARREARDQPPRPRRARARRAPRRRGADDPHEDRARRSLSVVSNSLLIALKLAAGAITGSIAIITEAIHSSIDLIASVIALIVSVRKADEPADADHPYGHEKVENLAAAIEGMLILVGAGVIIFEATRRLVNGAEVESLGVGIAVIAFSVVANLVVSTYLYRRAREHELARARGRRRPPARRRADLGRGARRPRPGRDHRRAARSTRSPRWSSPCAIVGRRDPHPHPLLPRARRRGAARPRSWTGSRRRSPRARPPEMAGYHKLRARRAGSRRHIDLHVQFRSGTTLERAHAARPRAARRDRGRAPDAADVLIHVEPEASRPPEERPAPARTEGEPPFRPEQVDRGRRARRRRRRSRSRCSR